MEPKVVLIVLFSALLSLVNGATLHVPGDYPTIQAALMSALPDDTVLVAPGIYFEHITWPSTNGIKLLSEYGPDTTIIDAAGALRCITMNVSMDSSTIISGFTIRNGNMADGGGISCVGASPCITDNIISYNSYGSGIWIDSGDPLISNNIITHNTGVDGGGIFCRMFSNPRILNNLIEHNSATSQYGSGGGICTIDAQPIIEGNTIHDNSAYSGGGIYTFKTYAIITYNTITNNTAEYGDGVRLYQSDAIVNYNDIFLNGYGVSSGFTPEMINVKNNWWGDASGPYHASNPGGLGDTVSDYLDFSPWLTKPHGIEENLATAYTNVYLQVNPNPFNQHTEIRFMIRDSRSAGEELRNAKCEMRKQRLEIYDVMGRLVRSLCPPTTYCVPPTVICWDGTDQCNRQCSPGIYFLRLNAGDDYLTRKLVLID
jgi:parallel beta-helix repeat protein